MYSTLNKTTIQLAAALLVGLAASCNREMAGDPGRDDSHEGNPSTIMQIQASADGLDGGATKVDIAVSDGAFTWSRGDAIAVYSTEDGYVEFSLKRGAGTASGTFAQEFSGTRANYAVYPASVRDDNHYTSGDFHINYPASYEINMTKSDWETYYATYSPLPMVADNSQSSLSFKHVGGIFRITLNQVPTATKMIVVSTGEGEYIAGNFTVNNPGTESMTIAEGEGSSNSVTFHLSSALASETSGIVLNLPVPAGTTYSGLRVECRNSSSEALSRAVLDNAREVTRASGREMSLNCAASATRLANFSLSLTELVDSGESGEMTFTATNLAGEDVTPDDMTFSFSPSGIATVSYDSGTRKITVTGVADGTATLTATAKKGTDRITASAIIVVSSPSAETGMVSVSSTNAIVYAGQSSNKVTLAASSSLTSPSYAWSITSGGSYVSLSAISGSSVTLTGSTAGTATIRCYATGSDGFHYDDVAVAVAPDAYTVGGVFNDGSNDFYFARANLQAQISGWSSNVASGVSAWKLMDDQFAYYTSVSTSENAWWDHFGWNGNDGTKSYGLSTSTTNSDYGNTTGETLDSTHDWSQVAGKSTNLGGTGSVNTLGWRTLTSGQHSTVFVEGASNKCLRSTVNSKYGLVVKPTSGTISLKSTYTLAEWKLAELEGYVFLPAAGFRDGSSIGGAGSYGYYWSSSSGTSFAGNAYGLYFYSSNFRASSLYNRFYGYCVRPVHNK